MTTHEDLEQAIADTIVQFRDHSKIIHTDKWQGVKIKSKPEMATHELLNYGFSAWINSFDPRDIAKQVKPNLPWADMHFRERIGGEPLNPGETWKNWPWSLHADKFRLVEQTHGQPQFNHTYMERYWPRFAGMTPDGVLYDNPQRLPELTARRGIRLEYGDLDDLIKLLQVDPYTRQAWVPIFFPEDTGYGDGGRKPCSLGYQFILRDDRLHVYYPLRSCDLVRHFRDDIYLTVLLLFWVIEHLRMRDVLWNGVTPGTLTMHMTSLHCFRNDWYQLYGHPGSSS